MVVPGLAKGEEDRLSCLRDGEEGFPPCPGYLYTNNSHITPVSPDVFVVRF